MLGKVDRRRPGSRFQTVTFAKALSTGPAGIRERVGLRRGPVAFSVATSAVTGPASTRRAVPPSIAVAARTPDSCSRRSETMRTLIEGGWVVGYSGSGHELIPNGCVVFEDDRVVHVGPRFEGPVDRRVDAAGKLVSPGLINCHLHAATNAGQAVFLDGLKADYFGSNFVGYVAPRRGTAVPRAGDRADVAGTYGL